MTSQFALSLRAAGRYKGLALPLFVIALTLVLLTPLPPGFMDLLLVCNIALAALILLTTIFVSSPLEFSVFPSLLLGATLFRLTLNVASTRLILTAGAQGRSLEEAHLAAGGVIWSFSRFVTLDSLEVGLILFAVLAVIQFVVITKGAGRISEVAARFVLDALPGKQMAIDADLGAGLINETQARQRREQLSHETDFYGAMDGASKFIRGDAIAGVLITLVNIVGGMYVGMVRYDWGLGDTADLFTRLTIGDGLVNQVPALLISVAAALLVTRSAARANLGEQMVSQLTARPVALVAAGVFLAALSLTSLPKTPLLMLAVGCVGLAWLLGRTRKNAAPDPAAGAVPAAQDVQTLLNVEPVRIELGYALAKLADPQQGGDLLDRIATLRRQLAEELGLLVPAVTIKDSLGIDSHSYAIYLRGAKVGGGRLYPRLLLALGSDRTTGTLPGREALEPIFSTPAVWIAQSDRATAQAMNYSVTDAPSVLLTHLGQTLRAHGADLLTRQQVNQLLENLRATAPNLVQEAQAQFKGGQIQKVLQNLLRERVSIRDLEAILEAMLEAAERTSDVAAMTEQVRSMLARSLTQQFTDRDGRLWCVSLDRELEQALASSRNGSTPRADISPEAARSIGESVVRNLQKLRRQGRQPVLLCSPQIRPALSRMVASLAPDAAVLGYNEVDNAQVQAVGSVRIES